MNFESIEIKNFRNFDNIKISLANKNVFFGLNDVGKTNFLYALRYVFDKDIRKLNFLDSDFHCKCTATPIEITVTLDISDIDCEDNQKLRAQLKGALLSSHKKVYIKLIAQYDGAELIGIPVLHWGGDLNHLYEMKQRGYLYEIDYVINVIYIDSYVDLYHLFKKNVNMLIKNESDDDKATLNEIDETVNILNSKIATLSGIKDFEGKITPEYRKFRNDNTSVSVKSEIAIKGLYSNIVPYIKHDSDDNLYPTSGEGRKKLLVYSIFDLISNETAENRINLFLVEEPENHLHKSIQIALSKILFDNEKYKYIFISTHSPYILYEMDKVNLVRIYNENKIDSASTFHKVPEKYEESKKLLNKNLSEAIFADKVLLVEGISEIMLFEKVLSVTNPFYEADGVYILMVNGIGFEKYYSILDSLKIKVAVKTDNDLRSARSGYSVLGFHRCNNIIGKKLLPTETIKINTVDSKRDLYNKNIDSINHIRDNYHVFLSKCDLENDLDEAIHSEMVNYLGTDEVVDYLQDSKHYHMVELIEKLTDDDCRKIYEHYNFACLKDVIS